MSSRWRAGAMVGTSLGLIIRLVGGSVDAWRMLVGLHSLLLVVRAVWVDIQSGEVAATIATDDLGRHR